MSREKHVYQINVLDCANDVVNKLKKTDYKGNLSIEEYQNLLNHAVIAFDHSKQLSPESSLNEKFNKRIISVDHPAFYFWFACFLSTQDSNRIPLILDKYDSGDFGAIDNFSGSLEFMVIEHINNNILYDTNECVNEIIKWIRVTKKEKQTVSDQLVQFGKKEFSKKNTSDLKQLLSEIKTYSLLNREHKFSSEVETQISTSEIVTLPSKSKLDVGNSKNNSKPIIIKFQDRIQLAILKAFKEKVEDTSDLINLKTALTGAYLPFEKAVQINVPAIVLGDFFAQILKGRYYQTTYKSDIVPWICTTFKSKKKSNGEYELSSPKYMTKLLSLKSVLPSDERIDFKAILAEIEESEGIKK